MPTPHPAAHPAPEVNTGAAVHLPASLPPWSPTHATPHNAMGASFSLGLSRGAAFLPRSLFSPIAGVHCPPTPSAALPPAFSPPLAYPPPTTRPPPAWMGAARPPLPRGRRVATKLCTRFFKDINGVVRCPLGSACTFAHSAAELAENAALLLFLAGL